ncbi:MAG: hypothetical protein AAGF12_43265 [Myxococcota bacterium]
MTSRELTGRKKRLLRWFAIAAVAPAILMFVIITIFVANTELAHDEGTCPFSEVEARTVTAGVSVVEEARRCQEAVEERRWVVHRSGETKEIGRRRLHQALYEGDGYRWSASVQSGFVEVLVKNEGVEDLRFLEHNQYDEVER